MHGRRILLLGVTYKPGIADQRESPAMPLAHELRELGADVAFYDAFVDTWQPQGRSYARVDDVDGSLRDADLIIHLQPHPDYDSARINDSATAVLDTRGVLTGDAVTRL